MPDQPASPPQSGGDVCDDGQNDARAGVEHAGQLPAIRFDPQDYMRFTRGYDLSEAEQLELLQTIWQIVVQFVDLGFGIHPVQQACEQGERRSPGAFLDILDLLQAAEAGKGETPCRKR